MDRLSAVGRRERENENETRSPSLKGGTGLDDEKGVPDLRELLIIRGWVRTDPPRADQAYRAGRRPRRGAS